MSKKCSRRGCWPPGGRRSRSSTQRLKGAASSLVVVEIEPDLLGSRLSITESGFEGISGDILEKVFEANASGWTTQIRQLELFLSGAIDLRPIKD